MKKQLLTKRACGKATLLSTTLLLIFILGAVNLNAEIFVLNTISQTISKYNIQDETINNAFAVTGLYPNRMAVDENYIYLTNSGDNNVQKIDILTGETVNHILLPEFSNPYDIIHHNDYLYVTGLLSNMVYKISLVSESVVDEVEAGIAPQGLLIVNNSLYVANSGFSYPDFFFGTVSVIDLDSFTEVDTIPVHFNPQRMALDSYSRIHLVCTGDYDENTGTIMIIDTAANIVVDSVSFGNFPYNIVIPPNNRSYVGDAFNMGVFAYDVETLDVLYDADNPFAAGGGGLISIDDYIIIADAKDFQSNSLVSFYGLDEEFKFSFEAAIGAIDVATAPRATSVESELLVPRLSVYPNPAKRSVRIDVLQPSGVAASKGADGMSSDHKVGIYNIRGQLIAESVTVNNTAVWEGVDYNEQAVPTGIYFVRISDKNGQVISTKAVTLIR